MTDEPTEPTIGQAPADGQAPAAPPPPSPAPPGPAPAAARSANGAPVRAGVVAIGVATLIAVVALVLWDGGASGSTGTAGGLTPESTAEVVPAGSGVDRGSDAASAAPATEAPATASPEPATEAPTTPVAPLDPNQIAPSEAMISEPILAGVHYQWRVSGRVDLLAERYLAVFPQPGYSITGGLGADHPSGQTINVFVVYGPGGIAESPVGSFLMMADPADPQNSTIIGLEIGRR